jgi:thiamine pyrophosphate-dependent acetolactate synthase large subunit-like protein
LSDCYFLPDTPRYLKRGIPYFSRYAENCGAMGIRVTARDDLRAALDRLFSSEGPAMLEIMTDAKLI